MNDFNETKTKYISLGIFAHVDAGKTSTSEALLYHAKAIKKTGRVDHGDAFLDTEELEKKRGITIFSKQALFSTDGLEFTLLDTPGHVDFSPEMERVVDVIDMAIVVVSATELVQSHTRTVWRLLRSAGVPVVIFVNKTDLLNETLDRAETVRLLSSELKGDFVDFTVRDDSFYENMATGNEAAMEEYLESLTLKEETVVDTVVRAQVFPVLFGSALKDEGVSELLSLLGKIGSGICDDRAGLYHDPSRTADLERSPEKQASFSARVFKISRDRKGERLTHMRIFSGSLSVREMVGDEKITGIRIYNGEKYDTKDIAFRGQIVAVTGLATTYTGQGLGGIRDTSYTLVPVLSYAVKYPDDVTTGAMMERLKLLEEEEPTIHTVWNEQTDEIMLQMMGRIGIDVLKERIADRFGIAVSFEQGKILYRETVTKPFEGVGHFEPLRHYAEAHILIEPAPAGNGITVSTDCPEDILDGNFQRLIATHLLERRHKGVLTGSPLDDVHIRVISGRSHEKHTCGGDFRQAAYRAVRHALMRAGEAGCVRLLEPFYRFEMRLPASCVGRALNDINLMGGEIIEQYTDLLRGEAPVQKMYDYAVKFASYTGGEGSLSLDYCGYRPVTDEAKQQQIVEEIAYDAASDVKNDAGSVFCSHGTGQYVPWQEVEFYMHLPWCYSGEGEFEHGYYGESEEEIFERAQKLFEERARRKEEAEHIADPGARLKAGAAMDKELMEIYEREFGPVKRRENNTPEVLDFDSQAGSANTAGKGGRSKKQKNDKKGKYLLVDGYNVIFAWDELKELADLDIGAARGKLIDILTDYAATIDRRVILVFDAYRVAGGTGSTEERDGIFIVFTKESQTADAYIEATVHDMAKKHDVCVATSDGLEQTIVLGEGAVRMSSRELKAEIEAQVERNRRDYTERNVVKEFNRPFSDILR